MVVSDNRHRSYQGSVMVRSQAENREFYIAGVVWNIWADYWTSVQDHIPPLHYMRTGGGEDFIFVSGVSEQKLNAFLKSVQSTADLRFTQQGDWWLTPVRWFGHWTVFSAGTRQPYVGIERRVWGGDEVIDFDSSGDSRMTQLRSAGEPNNEAM